MTFNWFAVLVDDELCKVPLDSINQSSTLFLLQELEQGMCVLAIDVNLLEQVEVNFAILDEALNLFSVSGFLMAKLVAGESENTQTCWEKMKSL
jgi:hypothetical protein